MFCLIAALWLTRAADNPPPLALGSVSVNARARMISFPAVLNMRKGAIEYLAVHETGKVHESIFKTSVSAKEIHAAALLFAAGRNASSCTRKK